jgi:hypothetical protein
MSLKAVLAATVISLSTLAAAPGLAFAGVSIAGDNDCFGFGGSCPDGTLWETGLGGVFFTSNQGPGDAPFTDIWGSFADPNFSLATPGAGPVTLVTRIAGVADNRGPWDVDVNGFLVGVIPDNTTANAFQEVLTYSYSIPSADLLPINNVVLKINDPLVSDGYDIDFVSLVTSGGVPEPGAWAMIQLGVGLVGAGLRLARGKDRLALTKA